MRKVSLKEQCSISRIEPRVLTTISPVGKIQLSKVCSRLTNDKYPKLFSTSFLNRYILIQCSAIIFIMPGLAHHGSKKVHRPTFFIFVKV